MDWFVAVYDDFAGTVDVAYDVHWQLAQEVLGHVLEQRNLRRQQALIHIGYKHCVATTDCWLRHRRAPLLLNKLLLRTSESVDTSVQEYVFYVFFRFQKHDFYVFLKWPVKKRKKSLAKI